MTKIKHLFLAALIAGLSIACSSEQQYAALPANANVLILGDSLSYGTGAAKGEDYPSLLAASTGWNIINEGVPGDTTAGGLDRLPDLLETHQVDLLVVELGGNDFLRRLPLDETRKNLHAILSEAKASNIQSVLIGIPQFTPLGAAVGNLSDHLLYEELAEQTDTPLVGGLFSKVLASNALKSDPIHPNAEGYRIVEENLREALAEKGFLK